MCQILRVNVTYESCTYLSFAFIEIFRFIHIKSNKYLHIQSFIYLLIPNICWLFIQIMNTEERLVTMSVSLYTQTGWPNLTIQVLNTKVWFLNIWYTSLTSVYGNLEHALAILTESFSPLKSEYTASLVEIQIRSNMTSHAIPDTVYLSCAVNWAKPVWTSYSHNQLKAGANAILKC